MSQTPNNIDPKEATEARLCAYLEGELSPSERAEIEKYLETNPQHRQLLSELATTRKWLSALPHESAPAEIAEAFEGQLERSMLLDGSGATESAATIRHWPKFFLAAAMVVLALGLGTVVYFTLPGAPPPKYSVVPPPAPGSTSPLPGVAVTPPSAGETMMSKTGPSVSPATESMGKTADDELSKSPAGLTPNAPVVVQNDQANIAPTNAPPVAAAGPTIAGKQALEENAAVSLNSQNQSAPVITSGGDDVQALRDRLLRSGPPGSDATNTLYLLVSSENPSTAAHTVENYFASNGILYDSHPADQSTAEDKDKESFNLKQGPEQANRIAPLGMPATEPVASARLATAGNLYRALPSDNSNNFAAKNLNGYNNNAAASNDAMNAQAANAQPQVQSQNAEQLPAQQQQLAQNGFAPATPADEQVYVARGLTPDQAERLRITLTTPVQGQHAQVLDGAPKFRGDISAIPATMPATNPVDVITTDDRLRVTVAQLVGPGVDKTNTVHVADDGTISLPMIEPVKAVGLTPVEVEKQIATKYRDANLINDATVNVDRVIAETQPTTAPAEVAAGTTQPATEPAVAQAKPAVEKVDVVILIAKSAAATQPVMAK
jgi:Polysaccharide biosynthesis/export protein